MPAADKARAGLRAGNSDSLTPITADQFASHMAALGPFERAPEIAVAVSGGRDSMCLALLANDWGRAQGGSVVALTVDHGLRPDSASEAQQVGRWLAALGIDHQILAWSGPYPESGIQAAARAARYELMETYCRERALLHLLVAHHREDQAETVLIRAESKSGATGLAGMAAISEREHVRLLRPLLDVPRASITAYLENREQEWIEDPSNQNVAMARGRLRARLDGSEISRAIQDANEYAQQRICEEQNTAALAAQVVRFHPAGFIILDRTKISAAPVEEIERLIARSVMAVAGRVYSPRSDRTRRLCKDLTQAGPINGRTLGGCRIIAKENCIFICRESVQVGPPVSLNPGENCIWDDRFRISVTKNLATNLRVDILGTAGWKQVKDATDNLTVASIPHAVRLTFPALWQGERVLSVPHMRYSSDEKSLYSADVELVWRPPGAVAPTLFAAIGAR